MYAVILFFSLKFESDHSILHTHAITSGLNICLIESCAAILLIAHAYLVVKTLENQPVSIIKRLLVYLIVHVKMCSQS